MGKKRVIPNAAGKIEYVSSLIESGIITIEDAKRLIFGPDEYGYSVDEIKSLRGKKLYELVREEEYDSKQTRAHSKR